MATILESLLSKKFSGFNWLEEIILPKVAKRAFENGIRSENALTNHLFALRNPELAKDYKIPEDNTAQIQEWLALRDQIVRPLLQQSQSGTTTVTSASTTSGLTLPQKLGVLTVDITNTQLRNSPLPKVKDIQPYSFSAEDALWLARFIEGEASLRPGKEADSYAVVWAMFNRFALFRHLVPGWKNTFHVYLRLYSTPLQPFLKSCGATLRVYRDHKDKPDQMVFGEMFRCGEKPCKCQGLKQVQTKRHITIQNKPWGDFKQSHRDVVINILTGKIPNPGIGLATEFASSWVYFKDHYGHYPKPDEIEKWRDFTRNVGKDKKPPKGPWTWIGEKPNLDQKRNAFFVEARLKNVPPTVVKVM